MVINLYIFNKVDFNPNEKIDIIYLLIKKCNFNFNRLDVLCKNEKEIEDTNKVPLKFKKSIQSDLEDLKENITSLLIEKIKETLEYTRGFLKSVQGKLQNDRFIASAPENIVASEKVKEADAINKINLLQEKLNSLVQ